MSNLPLWLTPIWLVAVGVTAGALALLVAWGLLWLVNRKAAAGVAEAVLDGPLLPIAYVVGVMAAVTLFTLPSVNYQPILASLGRLGSVGPIERTLTVPPRSEDFEVDAAFRAGELVRYEVQSDQDVRVGQQQGATYTPGGSLLVEGSDGPEGAYVWTPSSKFPRYFAREVSKLYLTNEGDAPAQVTLKFLTDVPTRQVRHLGPIVGSIVGLVLAYLLVQWTLPRLANIAVATSKEALAQPLCLLFLLLGACALVVYIYVPYNTFGEDVKMLKDSGLTTIMVLAIVFSLWTASATIADEIDGKTALTLLSKPISRRQFILGKYLGIVLPALVMFVVLGAVLMACVSYKVVYDARETSNPQPVWTECYDEMIQVAPGLVLAFLETCVLAAISVAISTRLPVLPNLIICGSIYVLGHLGPLIVQSSIGQIQFVEFIGKLIAVVAPNLDHFNIQAAVAANIPVPWVYLGWATVYAVLYATAAMLLALILFEDRDLA